MRSRLLLCLVGLASLLHCAVAAQPELQVRDGLPNAFAKLTAGEEVRVAFLGGSITAAEGWRPKTLAWFRERYPKATVTEIFAAISGTNSAFGAARLQRDVLRHKPDLLFVEFAVNDGAESKRVELQMEGIVRQTWAANPATDICFVYTVSKGHLKDLATGSIQGSARSMERVADHYGIPSFNFGIEIADRLAMGSLLFDAPKSVAADDQGNDPQGRLIFTRDGTHPTDAGHVVYAAGLTRSLPAMLGAGKAGPRALSEPLDAANWQFARILPLVDLEPDARWQPIPADLVPENLLKRGLLLPTLRTFEPGASVEFRFTGTRLGIVGLKGPDNGQFRVTVDGQLTEIGTLFDAFSAPGRYYPKTWYFPHTLSDGEHHVRLELIPDRIDKASIMAKGSFPIREPALFEPHGLYLSGFIVAGGAESTTP